MILTLPACNVFLSTYVMYACIHTYIHTYIHTRHWTVKVRSRDSLSYFMSPYATSVCGLEGRSRAISLSLSLSRTHAHTHCGDVDTRLLIPLFVFFCFICFPPPPPFFFTKIHCWDVNDAAADSSVCPSVPLQLPAHRTQLFSRCNANRMGWLTSRCPSGSGVGTSPYAALSYYWLHALSLNLTTSSLRLLPTSS